MKKYTIEEIKKVYWDRFHKCGELWFDYLSDDKENNECTESEWNDFLEELKKIK